MSGGAIFVICVVASFPLIIVIAVMVKLWEVRQASRWPSTTGNVIASGVRSTKNKPGDPGYNFGDTEVSNEPNVEYEYQVAGRKYRCRRITIGEKTSSFELESILQKYPVGQAVTVYYNPADPNKAVLERDLPMGILMAGVGCLLLFFIGGPLLGIAYYFSALDWLRSHLHDPSRAPFVAALSGFGLLCLLFTLAFWRYVGQAARWPTVPGKIIASSTEAFVARDLIDGRFRKRIHHKSSVQYEYEVNGRKYSGDRLTIGLVISANFPGYARRVAAKYPVGKEVDVHYDPSRPGESVLQPRSAWHLLLPIIVVGVGVLVWAVATGRI
jgi:hypothetical protein